MEYEEKAEVKEEKIYNLFRCGYLEVREWLKETDIVIIPLAGHASDVQYTLPAPLALFTIGTTW